MLIRQAFITDIDHIMKIEKASFIPQIQEEKDVFIQRIKCSPSGFLVFIDEASEQIAGYICGEAMSEIPQTALEIALGHNPKKQKKNAPFFYISSFAILPEFRGNGNGKKLWNECLNYFLQQNKELKYFLLLVNKEWENARHIYENSGFELINTFKDFFPAENGINTDGLFYKRATYL